MADYKSVSDLSTCYNQRFCALRCIIVSRNTKNLYNANISVRKMYVYCSRLSTHWNPTIEATDL